MDLYSSCMLRMFEIEMRLGLEAFFPRSCGIDFSVARPKEKSSLVVSVVGLTDGHTPLVEILEKSGISRFDAEGQGRPVLDAYFCMAGCLLLLAWVFLSVGPLVMVRLLVIGLNQVLGLTLIVV